MTEVTATEALQRSIDSMGEELGRTYHALWQEVASLHIKWGEYVELFGKGPSRIELINRAAGQYFRLVQDALWEDALLHLARVSDSPKSMGKDNLSVRRLPGLIADAALREKTDRLVQAAIESTEFCRDWRNRRIAHTDLLLALRTEPAQPLADASRNHVSVALKALANVLNAISLHYENATTTFGQFGPNRGALALLYVIDDGLRVDEERRQRLEAGEYRPEDSQRRSI